MQRYLAFVIGLMIVLLGIAAAVAAWPGQERASGKPIPPFPRPQRAVLRYFQG